MATRRAITLGEANGAGAWLDLDDPANKKFFLGGSKPLNGDPYDGKGKGLRLFLERLRGRVRMYCWGDVLDVPDLILTPVNRNILDNYGLVSLEECTAHAESYYIARNQASQNARISIVLCVIIQYRKSLYLILLRFSLCEDTHGFIFYYLITHRFWQYCNCTHRFWQYWN